VLLAAAAVGAQTLPPSPAGMITLPGEGCAVRYRAGGLDRAHHVVTRLELITRAFKRWSKIPIPQAVYLLGREEWDELKMPRPFTFPVRTGLAGIALAVEGDDVAVADWRRLLQVSSLPMVPGIPLQGTAEQAATLALGDVLLQSEASRGFVVRSGMRASHLWINEVTAHVTALAIFHEYERERIPEIAATYQRMTQPLGGPGVFALEAYRADLPVDTWLWYQGSFFAGAEIIYRKSGPQGVAVMQKLAKKSNGVLNAEDLLDRYKGLADWLASSFGSRRP
jgi:hypothetical protein